MNDEELVLYLSLHYLDDISLVRACQVNTRFYQRVCNQIWFDRLEENYSDIINMFPETIKSRSYKDQYLLLQDLNTLKSMFEQVEQFASLNLLDIYQLKRFNLIGLGLKFLPREIGQLTNLEWLFVSNNQLTELPLEIKFLNNLRLLYIDNNQITNLPQEIKFLTNLRTLNLRKNKLTELPLEIKFLTNLKSLDVSYNQLEFLPQEIGQLNNLEALNLSNNQLTELPIEIKFLTNLNNLNIYKNQLTNLPQEIRNMLNLKIR